MSAATIPPRRPSEVASWHLRSGRPDNVTDEGLIVEADAGRMLAGEKAALRATISRLSRFSNGSEVRSMARLAGSYLLAGDVETARRYIGMAEDLLAAA